ncbi:MAG: hypothetical protein EOO61_04245 [Hymenobacter sp.]|nr:MAG: hypothetical protein EOO61_04245 [Hymenobacter sp.]
MATHDFSRAAWVRLAGLPSCAPRAFLAAREKSWVAMTQNAQANLNNRQAAQLVALLRATGATLRAIADQLNQSGYRTRHGKFFHPMGVQRLLPKPTQ